MPEDHSIKLLCSRNFETWTWMSSFFVHIVLINDTFWSPQDLRYVTTYLLICITTLLASQTMGSKYWDENGYVWKMQNKSIVSWRIQDQLDVTCYFISLLIAQHVSDINKSTIRSLRNSNTHRTKNNTTNVVIQQSSRKLLMMDILISETCWAHKKWNKVASDIKLVFYSSTITMMHGPLNKIHYCELFKIVYCLNIFSGLTKGRQSWKKPWLSGFKRWTIITELTHFDYWGSK